MRWYWQMGTRKAAAFFVAQFVAVALLAYVALGLSGGGWTTPVSFFVPMVAGIVGNLAWSAYNVSKL